MFVTQFTIFPIYTEVDYSKFHLFTLVARIVKNAHPRPSSSEYIILTPGIYFSYPFRELVGSVNQKKCSFLSLDY